METKSGLTLNECGILFSIFALGWSLSTLIFILEHFIQSKLKKTDSSTIWAFFDRFTDAKRYYFKNLLENHRKEEGKEGEKKSTTMKYL